jgi:hypothetical protein
VAWGLACVFWSALAQPVALVELRHALRVGADGATQTVTLPDTRFDTNKRAQLAFAEATCL